MQLKFNNIPPETIFIIIGLIYGLAFLFITPPFNKVPDENAHFDKAYSLSEGQVLPLKIGNEAGFIIPKTTLDTIKASFNENINLKGVITSKVNINGNKNITQFVDLSYLAIVTYSPVPYVMAALTIKLGGLLNLSTFTLLYMARFANFLIWLILTYLAIKIIPVHKWVLLMIALLPMTIFEAASVSADSLTIGLSFILIAYILRLALNNYDFTKKDFFIILILAVLLTLTKSNYILILFLFLLIPVNKFQTHKKKYLIFSIIIIPIILISAGWIYWTNGFYMPNIINWSLPGQFSFILHQPLNYLIIITNTFLNGWFMYVANFVSNILPLIIVVVYLFTLILVAILDKNEFQFNLKQKIVCLIIALSSIFAIVTFEYLTYNPLGINFIYGIQGRYFIPIAPIIILIFYNKKEYITLFNKKFPLKMDNIVKTMIIAAIIILLSYTLLMFLILYYS
jgi:uncharacterized membrane protein